MVIFNSEEKVVITTDPGATEKVGNEKKYIYKYSLSSSVCSTIGSL